MMINEAEVQEQLNDWADIYCPEEKHNILFGGYEKHNKHNYEGYTRYRRMDIACWAEIYVKPIYKNRSTLRKIVLWHEFCHAWCWCSIGVTGHGWEFFKRIIQKPHLFLGQVGLAFVVPFLKG